MSSAATTTGSRARALDLIAEAHERNGNGDPDAGDLAARLVEHDDALDCQQARAIIEDAMVDTDETAARMSITDMATAARMAKSTTRGATIELTSFDKIEAKRTDWLWSGWLPRGMLTLLVGQEDRGKSLLTIATAAALTRGELGDTPADVAFLSTEEDPARIIRPRLEAAEADLARVHYVRLAKDGRSHGAIRLPEHAEQLGKALHRQGVRLAVVDPLFRVLDPRLNQWKQSDVIEALTPLAESAWEHDFAVLGTMHTNKARGTDARERAMSSVGFRSVARVAWQLGLDPDDPRSETRRALAAPMMNVGRMPRSRRLDIRTHPVQVEGHETEQPYMVIGDECDWRADDLLAAEAGHAGEDDKATKLREAERFLVLQLRDGPQAVRAVEDAADAAGIAMSTLKRARKALGVESHQVRTPGGGNAWQWELPAEGEGRETPGF